MQSPDEEPPDVEPADSAEFIEDLREFEQDEYVVARDGVLARRAGPWAREKLGWLERFATPALTVTRKFRRRVFVDLFAGPGLNRTRDGQEFEGSPLVALRSHARSDPGVHFTDAHFVNLDNQAERALRQRVAMARRSGRVNVPEERVVFHDGDANQLVEQILGGVPPGSFTFVMADITRISHFPFSTVQRIAGRGNRALDFYVLLPIEMGIIRLLPWKRELLEPNVRSLTAFFGTDAWRDLYEARQSSSQRVKLKNALIELYIGQLKQHWEFAGVMSAPRKSPGASLYRMIYATRNDTAFRIAVGSKPRAAGGQRDLFG